jgi:hypothetical protein
MLAGATSVSRSTVLLIFTLKLLIEVIYLILIHPNYAYLIYPLSFSLIKYVEGTLLFGLALRAIETDDHSPSTLLLGILLIFYILPLTSYYALADKGRPFVYVAVGSFLLTALVVNWAGDPKKELLKKVTPLGGRGQDRLTSNSILVRSFERLSRSLTERHVLGGLLLHTAFVIGGVAVVNEPPSLAPLFLQDIYAIRSSFVTPFPAFVYVMNWQGLLVTPFLLVYGLLRRRPSFVGIASFVWILLYLYIPFKLYLGVIVAALCIIFCCVLRVKFVDALIYLSISMIVGVSGIWILTGNYGLAYRSAGRLFFVGVRLNYLYVDYFSTHPHIYLTNTFLNPFMEYPYAKRPPLLIAEAYFGSDFNPNVGYLAKSFAQFGYVAPLVYGIVLGFLARTLNFALSDVSDALFLPVAFGSFWMLTQVGLTTVGLTFGMGPLIVFALLWPSNETATG